ncbi:uncharacterized protein AMSG_11406 [Thecamonas trahens ATCC 50062]|uniref:F-box/LRR-repeat protein 15-like leucin rich repeat domain-containing protein n=1 Tax=Thecamonas trahens ATCC 50062 TaxID=461836 RepID=A0A0L0DUR0_THETB|nr:hypothetical protein AMSG_11406 [Thecamonas trahens ATCC 50062]KNC55937.1 hypothetical protein AMSG_11406 [Thecamonas trahens ATCC 50062]|eukprot:XP_013752709.1 hypothetical protein AMSG_11406 [Thecamonas trahens ATCC 50062]
MCGIGLHRAKSSMASLPWLQTDQRAALRSDALPVLARLVPQLEQLDLSGALRIGGGELESLLASASSLKSLSLARVPGVTDAALEALVSAASGSLTAIDLFDCRKITDAGLSALAQCTQLQSVVLAGCLDVTVTGLAALADGAPGITTLSLAGLLHLSDSDVLETLGPRLAALTSLDVRFCRSIELRHDMGELYEALAASRA